jgi:HEAT repeat protein
MKIYSRLFIMVVLFISGCTGDVNITQSPASSLTQEIAENAQGPLPADTLPELIANLSNDDPQVRVVSAYALEKFGRESALAIPALEENLCYTGDSDVRRSAAIALGKLGRDAENAFPFLIAALINDGSYQVRAESARSLGKIGVINAVPLLASRLFDPDINEPDSNDAPAIESAEAIRELTGITFVDAGTGGYTLNEEGLPLIVVEARQWWESEGQFQDWSKP